MRAFRRWAPVTAHWVLACLLLLLFDGPGWGEAFRAAREASAVPFDPVPARNLSWADWEGIAERLVSSLEEGTVLPASTPVETEGAGRSQRRGQLPQRTFRQAEKPRQTEPVRPDPPPPIVTAALASTPPAPIAAAPPPPPPPPPALPDLPNPQSGTRSFAAAAAPATASPGGIPLVAGWNLISLPVEPDSVDPAAVFAPIAAGVAVVHAYDACAATAPWRTYNPAAAPGDDDLTSVDHRLGLWVRATSAATLTVSGTEPAETSIRLCQGWNLIGYPLAQPRPVLAALSSIAGKFRRVYGWDPADPVDPWEVFDTAVPAWANDLELMRPGRGYWLYATEATTLVMSNAGLPPEVEITSPPYGARITSPTDIAGIVRSNLLEQWTLAYRAKGETAFTTFASGNAPVGGAVLGTFDPTLLPNGLYEIELEATDFKGQSVATDIDVVVDGRMKLGHFSISFVDLEIPLAGIPIQVIRTYDSRNRARRGDFGFGWTLSVTQAKLEESKAPGDGWQGTRSSGLLPSYCVVPIRQETVTITLPDDTVYRFRPAVTPQCQALVPPQVVTLGYTALPGTTAALEAVGGNPQTLVVGSFPGTVELWDQDSTELSDPGRYRLTLRDGREFVIDQGGGIASIKDRNGNQLTFSTSGITHSSGVGVPFVRDAQGRITRISDPDGNTLIYSYDAPGDLASFADRENRTSHYGYNADHYLLSLQDPRGITPLRNEYDDSGRLIAHIDAFGKRIELSHRIGDRQEVVTNRLGHSRVLEYDLRGNVVRETNELGEETLRSFDARDNVLTETNPLGETITYTYDVSDNVTSVTDPLGHVTRTTYDSRGQVLTAVDPRGGVTANTYDAKGNLLTTTDAAGKVTTYTYDANGNQTSVTDPAGARTLFLYDGAGNMTQETDALGHVTTYTYDRRGNRLTEATTRTTSTGTETLVTTRVYDRQGQELSVTDAAGGVSSTAYDALGQVTARTDALGRTTQMAYDSAGRATATTYPDGTTETRGYDAEGRLTAQADRAGRVTTYAYDAAGRRLSTTLPGGAVTRNSYDTAGRISASTGARGNVTRFEYDAAGRRTQVIDALGHETRFFYDAAGDQTAFLDARGHTTQFELDALGQVTRTVFPDGTEARQTYDEVGRRTSATDQAGRTTRFSYDGAGRLVSVTDALDQVTAYAYDETGNRISQTDADGRTTRFGYDKLGRQTRRQLPDGSVETRTFDAVGNLLTHTDFSGATKTYTYDLMNRLVAKSLPGGSAVTFTYLNTGQRATQTDARGTTAYRYDVQDRLENLVYPDGRELAYTYDEEGNRTDLTARLAGGVTLSSRFSYDALNRLETVTDPLGREYAHGYDEVGNRARVRYPNGVTTRYTYNTLNRLTELTSLAAGGGVVASYAYTLGPSGNRTRIDEAGGVARSYTYDALYRLVGEEVTGSTGVIYRNGFSYDPVGNRLTQAKTASTGTTTTISYGYDTRDRLLTETGASYTWDANGNLRSKSGTNGATYTWDSENRLIRVDLANGDVVKHTYDADGNRVRTEVTPATGPPVVTDYLVDPSGELSQVVAETGAAGAWSQYFVRGDDLLSVLRPSATRFFHADGLGSIRALTDETGAVTDTYTFSAFGELLSHTGPDLNAYLFAGEPLDPNSGFYYLRARWVDPRVGRFGSVDTATALFFDPRTVHRYTYAGSDPADNIDPTGTQYIAEVNFNAAILGTLVAITAIVLLQTLGKVHQDLLISIGQQTQAAVASATRYLSEKLKTARKDLERLYEEAKKKFPRILFHYTSSKQAAESIYSTGEIFAGRAAGPFPPGAYATDLAGWLAVEGLRRSQLAEYIFGRNTPENYARLSWFVAFAEHPRYRFKKLTFAIYRYSGTATIIPLFYHSTLLGE